MRRLALPRVKRIAFGALGGGLILAIGLGWWLLPVESWVAGLVRWVDGVGPSAPWLFALIYAIALVFCAPGAPFSIGAGLAFGFRAVPFAILGATLGACGCFLVSRYVLRHRARRVLDGRASLQALDRAVTEEGWRIVFLLRLNPLIPFNVQNYFFGVTQIRFWPYAAATAVGVVPGLVLHVYLGVLGRGAGGAGVWRWVSAGVGLGATALVTLLLARKARSVLFKHGMP